MKFKNAKKGNIILFFFSTIFSIAAANYIVGVTGLAPERVYYWKTNIRDSVQRHQSLSLDYDVTYETNRQGLREYHDIPADHDGRIRIIYIGDSYTFGWGVERDEAIPKILERKLRTELQSDNIEVINFGVPGVNPFNFTRYVAKYIPSLNPDIIIVNVFKIRNTYLQNEAMKTLEGVQVHLGGLRQFVDAPIEDPEVNIRSSSLWHMPLFRMGYRAYYKDTKYGGKSYRLFNAAWPGVQNTIIDDRTRPKPSGAKKQQLSNSGPSDQCDAETSLPICSAKFVKSLKNEHARELFARYVKIGRIREICACDEPQDETIAALENAGENYVFYTDRIALHPPTRVQRENELRATVKMLGMMSQSSENMGADFIAMIFPEWATFGDLPQDTYTALNILLPYEDLKSPYMDNFIADRCAEERIRCIHGTTELREYAKGKPPESIMFKDVHYTAETNAVFAEVTKKAVLPFIQHRLAKIR